MAATTPAKAFGGLAFAAFGLYGRGVSCLKKRFVLDTKIPLRVAGAQIPVSGDVDANVDAVLRAIDFAAGQHADMLLTPEGSLSGYTHQFDATAVALALAEVTAAARVGLGAWPWAPASWRTTAAASTSFASMLATGFAWVSTPRP